MKGKLFYGISILLIIWFMLSTMEVWIHNWDSNYIYSKGNVWAILTTHTTEMKVVACEPEKETDTFIVTLEDIKGNQYDYYDSEYQYNNWVKVCVMQGTKIIDVKE